jgi:hypothetical protein
VHPGEPLRVTELGDERIVRRRLLDHERQERKLSRRLIVVAFERAALEDRARGAQPAFAERRRLDRDDAHRRDGTRISMCLKYGS